MLGELKAENRKLFPASQCAGGRVNDAAYRAAAAHERPAPAATAAKPAPAVASPPVVLPSPDLSETATNKPLGQRVKDLEIGWAAQENATRQIIQDTLSKTGPKINNYLALSGVVEGWPRGPANSSAPPRKTWL